MNESLHSRAGRLAAIREVLKAVPTLDEVIDIEALVAQELIARKASTSPLPYDDDDPAVRNHQRPSYDTHTFTARSATGAKRASATRAQNLLS